jgi:hypothetical protein
LAIGITPSNVRLRANEQAQRVSAIPGNRPCRASLALLATKTNAPKASEQPARKYSAISKLFVESLMQPTTNGPA